MKKDPNAREPRVPAIAIWTVSGWLLGLAFGLVTSSFPIPMVVGVAIGLAFGLYTTRTKYVPDED